jgi:hypothetical protein
VLGQLRVHHALAEARCVLQAIAAASVHPELVAPPKGGEVLVVWMDGNLQEGTTEVYFTIELGLAYTPKQVLR